MPSKNKPKRLDRARSWRVARRKAEQRFIASGGKKRTRGKRPKHKGASTGSVTKPEEHSVKKAVKKTDTLE